MSLKKYSEFINEARVYDMRPNNYALCNGNFKGVKGAKGQVAKITVSARNRDANRSLVRTFTLEFKEPLTVKRLNADGVEEETQTNTLVLNGNQIKNITVIRPDDYERMQSGMTLTYDTSEMFALFMRNINFLKNHNFYDISYFDVDRERDDMISFMPVGKMKQCLEDGEDPYKSRHRQSSKIGRVLRKINDKLTDPQYENFVNTYRATWNVFIKAEVNESKLQVVTGDTITYWYNEANYAKGSGSLNHSCMRHAGTQNRVAFYGKYPNKIAMAILLDDNNKLLARAIIWRLDEPAGVNFMDRIYYVLPIHEKMMEMYAAKYNIRTKKSAYNSGKKLVVKLDYKRPEPGQPTDLPYFDTFHYSETDKGFVAGA